MSSRPWGDLKETLVDTERLISEPRPNLTDSKRKAPIAQHIIAKEESKKITQTKRRVRESEDGDLVEDFVEETTVTRTRTWPNDKQTKQEWQDQFNAANRKLFGTSDMAQV